MAVPLNMTTPIVVNMDLYGCLVFLTCSVVFTVSRFILLKPSVNNPSYQTQQSLRCYDMPSFGDRSARPWERAREREKRERTVLLLRIRGGVMDWYIVTPAKPTPAQAELMCCYFWEPGVSRGDLMTQWRQCGSIADWRNWVASIWGFCSISYRKDGNE